MDDRLRERLAELGLTEQEWEALTQPRPPKRRRRWAPVVVLGLLAALILAGLVRRGFERSRERALSTPSADLTPP